MVMQRHRTLLTAASALAAAALVATAGSIPTAQASTQAPHRAHRWAATPQPRIHSVPGGVNVTWPAARYATKYRVRFGPAPWNAWLSATHNTRWLSAKTRSKVIRVSTDYVHDSTMMAVPYGNAVFVQVQATNPKMKGHVRKSRWIHAFPGAPTPAAGAPVRFGTYNVRLGGAAQNQQGGIAWSRRYPVIADNLARNHLDVVALQEIFADRVGGDPATQTFGVDDIVRALTARTGDKWEYAGVKADEGRIAYDSTKFAVLASGHVYVTNFIKGGKTTLPYAVLAPLVGDVPNRAQAFLVTSIHFVPSAPADGKHLAAVNKQTGQNARELLVQLADVKAALAGNDATADLANAPQIVAGDFTSGNLNYGDTGAPQPTLVRSGFYNAMAATVKSGVQWPTVNKLQYPERIASSGVGTTADTILMRGITGARYYRNVANFRGSSAEGTEVLPTPPSDHNLVFADIQIPTR